jgi:metal-responsive CopG/Arc/MetJ family transcriptional regulator
MSGKKHTSVRLPDRLLGQVAAYADERSMSISEAIRYILEEYLEREPKRQQSLKSLNRQAEILEYLFAANARMISRALDKDEAHKMVIEVSDAIRNFHPEL